MMDSYKVSKNPSFMTKSTKKDAKLLKSRFNSTFYR